MATTTQSGAVETGAATATETRLTLEVNVVDGGTDGTVELPAELFDVTPNIPLMHQVVVAQLAAARQGTHATKTRGQVRGGGRKPYRQKGTGRARQGSTRAPQFAGGGTVHGPQPRDYSQRTPKKMIAAALRSALSDRARSERIHVVRELSVDDKPSTKGARTFLARISQRPKVLVVLDRSDENGWLSLRNLPQVHALAADQLNTYDVLGADDVVFTSAALASYIARPQRGRGATADSTTTVSTETVSTETVSTETVSTEKEAGQ